MTQMNDIEEYMTKHGLTEKTLDEMAKEYEDSSYEPNPDGEIFKGSHLDAVSTKSIKDQQ
jgi:hypothetical protein